jgi:hypothetical protein
MNTNVLYSYLQIVKSIYVGAETGCTLKYNLFLGIKVIAKKGCTLKLIEIYFMKFMHVQKWFANLN